MRSFWFDPYLWIHLAGFAALPVLLELCLVGFAVGAPWLPVWLELLLVAVVGIVPVFWMQWQRPFYIFSVGAVALKPEQLTDDQRRLLTRFQSQRNRILAVIVALVLLVLLRQIYEAAAISAPVVPFPAEWRWAGLLLAAIAFLGSNLFFQVPLSVAGVMLTSDSAFAATVPHPTEQIQQNFTLLGLQVNQILPLIIPEPPPTIGVGPSVAVEPAVESLSQPDPTESIASAVEPFVETEATSGSAAPNPNVESDSPEDVW